MIVDQPVSISEFCETGSGTTPSRQRADYYGGSIPWVKSGELRETIITRTEEYVTERALAETSLKRVPSSAILVAMYGATVGRVGILGIEATTNQAVCHIVPDPQRADTRYMFHALQYKAQELIGRGVGGAQPNISQGIIKDTKIPLPPLDEQRRIAAILDQADALRRARRRAIERLNDLGQAIFRDSFFQESLTIPKARMGDVVEEFRYGTSEKSTPDGLPVLRIPNVIGGRIDCEDLKNVQLTINEINKLRLKEGDILFVRTNGNPEYVGRCAVVTDDIQNQTGYSVDSFVYASYLIRARLDHNLINPFFLKAYLSTQLGRKSLFERAKTSAGQYNINIESLSGIEIPLPDISRQKEFALKEEKISETASKLEAHFSYLDKLFSSLQHRAFRGEL